MYLRVKEGRKITFLCRQYFFTNPGYREVILVKLLRGTLEIIVLLVRILSLLEIRATGQRLWSALMVLAQAFCRYLPGSLDRHTRVRVSESVRLCACVR